MAMTDREASVRAATPSDAPAWLDMRVALWPEGDRDLHASEIEHYFSGTSTDPFHVLIAEGDGGALLGFAELSIRSHADSCTPGRIAYLEGWYVQSDVRRFGVGAALIRAAETWARSEGLREFASDALVDNAGSAAAHLALGFEEVCVVRCFRKALE